MSRDTQQKRRAIDVLRSYRASQEWNVDTEVYLLTAFIDEMNLSERLDQFLTRHCAEDEEGDGTAG